MTPYPFDPIGETGGLNLYGFVWNSPASRFDLIGLVGLPTDVDSVSQTIWQAIRREAWDEAIDFIEQEADLIDVDRKGLSKNLKQAVKQMRGMGKWRKQMGKWSRSRCRDVLESMKKTLKKHLDAPYRAGVDTPETLRFRYMIDYLERLLKQ